MEDDPDDHAARKAIASAIANLDKGRDRRDLASLERGFHEDAHLLVRDRAIPARDWIRTICTATDTLRSTHRTFGHVAVIRDDAARSRTDCIAQVVIPDGDMRRVLGGYYLDRHERRDGRWAVAARRFVLCWTLEQPAADNRLLSRLAAYGGHQPGKPTRSLSAVTRLMAGRARQGSGGDTHVALSLKRLRMTDDRAKIAYETVLVATAPDMSCLIRVREGQSMLRWQAGGWHIDEDGTRPCWEGRSFASPAALPFDHPDTTGLRLWDYVDQWCGEPD
jgi:hypothetical protein